MRQIVTVSTLICMCVAFRAFGQQPEQKITAPLFFQTEFKLPAKEHPVASGDLTNSDLVLTQYGPDTRITDPAVEHSIVLSAKAEPPIHIQTGLCTTPCALALKHRDNFVDLTGKARIKWRVWEYGFHLLRPIVKLADGTWLVGDHTDGYTTDYVDSEFLLADVHWRRLDINKVAEAPDGMWVDHADLSKVDEIGFTDLMPGAGHGTGGSSHVARIEVYGAAVKRDGHR